MSHPRRSTSPPTSPRSNNHQHQHSNSPRPRPPSRYTRPESFSTNPKEFAITWALFFIVFPILFPILLALYLYRAVVRLLATHVANLLEPLTPYDCIFAVDSYNTRPYASNLTVLELKHRIPIETVRQTFKSRILDKPQFSKLKCVPVEYLGWWFWKRLGHDVSEETTVRVYHDSELDESSPRKTLDDCLREIIEMPYGAELFNVLVLHFGTESVIVFRIHHTVCDGYSFNKLIDTFVGLESKYLVKRDGNGKGGFAQSVQNALSEIAKRTWLLLHLPLHLSTLYRESLTHKPNFYTLRKSSTTGTIRRLLLPLHKVKQIRSATDSHFAAVGMSLMTGALQKFYDENDARLQADPFQRQKLRPERLAIMHSIPKPNHPLTHLCNHWGVGLFKVPFTRNSVERMYGAEDDFNEYLNLMFDRLLHLHIPIVGLIPTVVVKWFFSINFGTSCGFTSVPGLFDKIAFVGGKDNDISCRRQGNNGSVPAPVVVVDEADGGVKDGSGNNGASCPVDNNGVEVKHMWKVFGLQWRQSAVAVAMYSYRGEASVSIYANKDIIPDAASMDRLVSLFTQEFDELIAHSNDSLSHNVAASNGGGGGSMLLNNIITSSNGKKPTSPQQRTTATTTNTTTTTTSPTNKDVLLVVKKPVVTVTTTTTTSPPSPPPPPPSFSPSSIIFDKEHQRRSAANGFIDACFRNNKLA